jgi:toxin ParE1/3/4
VRVVIHQTAYADIQEIYEWIASDSISNANSVSVRIEDAIDYNIGVHPFMGRQGDTPGTREWVVSGLPYIIIYEVDVERDTLTVRGVIHGARDR